MRLVQLRQVIVNESRNGRVILKFMFRLKRVRDLLLEILIVTILISTCVVYKFRHPDAELNWTRIALLVNTAIVFGYLIAWFRHAWRKPQFWAWLLVFLLGHVAAYVIVLSRIPQFLLIYYVILNVAELAVLESFLRRLISGGSQL